MSTWTVVQIFVDIALGVGVFVLIMRQMRAPKDDPRLSRGLQLLQSKISVLEDLSDRTELQVNQMCALLEQKAREVQTKIQLADRHVQLIRGNMQRSLEVARIFQDKIPHQEILERQNTIKYVQAARLAHQGKSVEEIMREVDLPRGEVEMIAKVNRDRLMFHEEQLPAWAQSGDAAQVDFAVSFSGDPQFPELPQDVPSAPADQYGQSNSHGPIHQANPHQFSQHQAPQIAPTFDQASYQTNDHAGQQTNYQMGYQESCQGNDPFDNFVDPNMFNSPDLTMQGGSEFIESAPSLPQDDIGRETHALIRDLERVQFELEQYDMQEQIRRENTPRLFTETFSAPQIPLSSLAKLGEEFRKACQDFDERGRNSGAEVFAQITQAAPAAASSAAGAAASVASVAANAAASAATSVASGTATAAANVAARATRPHIHMAATGAATARAAQEAPPPRLASLQAETGLASKENLTTLTTADLAPPKATTPAGPTQIKAAAAPRILNSRPTVKNTPPVVRKVQFPRIKNPEDGA